MRRSKNANALFAISLLCGLLLQAAPAAAQQHLTGQRFIEPVDIAPLPTGSTSDWSAQGVGVLDPDKGGLGIDLWAGSKARIVAQILGSLPADSGSWVLRKTLETALLSTARPPAPDDGSAAKDLDFIILRAAALQKMGMPHAAGRLIRAAGGLDQERRAAILAHTDLQNGTTKDACDWAATWSGTDDNAQNRPHDPQLAPFWARVQILCTVLSNQPDKARFMTALATEQGYSDGVFDQMVNAATLPTPSPEPMPLNRPAQDVVEAILATRINATAPLPRDLALRSQIIAQNAPVPSESDARLILRHSIDLARRDLMDLDSLNAIMARIPPAPSDADSLQKLKDSDYDTALRLLAGQISADNHDAPTYPALWQAMAQKMRPWRGTVLERLGGWLDAISPANNLQTDLDEIALTAALVRAAEGRDDDAARWLTIASPDQAQKGRLMLIPFDWLAGRFSDVAANSWIYDVLATTDQTQKNYAELALNLAAATGGVEADLLQPLLDQLPASSEPAALDQQQALTMVALDQAATEGQTGMVLLLAMQTVGRNDISTLDNGRIVAIVRALHDSGLEASAKMLAREALIGRLMPSVAPPPTQPQAAQPADQKPKNQAKKTPDKKSKK